jgi:polar amino acid transport system substrate-binding protein
MTGIRSLAIVMSVAAMTVAEARTLQQVLNSGNLRVGVTIATPWAMQDRDSQLIGYNIDIADKLAEDLGVAAEVVIYDFDRLIPALEADEIDVIVAGLSINPERARHVSFSRPYAARGVTLATHLANTASVERLDDLDDPAYTLGVVANSIARELAERTLPRVTLEIFEDVQSAGEALTEGNIDAFLEEEPIPQFLALENPSRIDVPLSRALVETRTGFAVRKGDPDFINFLNAWIVGHEDDTWLPTTDSYWFNSLRWRDRLSNVPDF